MREPKSVEMSGIGMGMEVGHNLGAKRRLSLLPKRGFRLTPYEVKI